MSRVGVHNAPDSGGPEASPPLVDTREARDALECPLCGYSLRGLSGTSDGEPAEASWARCPECGYACPWRALLHARQFRHPYLFEHHPRRTVGSFARTLVTGLRPARFWSSLHAGHELRPGRLVLYWAAVSVGVVASNALGAYAMRLPLDDWSPSPKPLSYLFEALDLQFWLALVGVVWPWLSLLALLVFQVSMRRARVRVGHVMRCVVYSGDVFVWTGVVAPLLRILYWALIGLDPSISWEGRMRLLAAGAGLMTVAAAYRLAIAYRNYLRFVHPVATVFASQLVVVMSLAAALGFLTREWFWIFL